MIKIFDSRKKEKIDFIPIKDKKVKIYACGPTVYDDAHLGHARSSISFDLLKRVLIANGYEVTFVKNFTDIDDKIINKSLQTGKSTKEITDIYTENYLRDMGSLNVIRADIEPKATESLDAIFELVQELIEKGFAYKLENGDVYFSVNKDKNYGALSHINEDDETQSRVCDFGKKDSRDFALWKSCKEEDICFDSPFGKGRPGWHIECSAMIKKHLAYENSKYEIDIHGGGADLLFPHHENEEAQSSCAHGTHLAKYWMHNGFVQINGEKMSKSLGNSFFVKDALKVYDGEILRFYLMGTHYRMGLNFAEEDLINSKKRLDKIYRLKKRIYGFSKKQNDKNFELKLLESMNDDLNISKALAIVDEMISEYNDILDKNPKDKVAKQKINSNIDFIEKVLGVGGKDAFAYFQLGIDENIQKEIEELILKRSEAKKEKNFKLADEIREQIHSLNVEIQDTPNGTLWEVKV